MKCPHCHATIDDDSVFCLSCGKVVEVKCPKCGKTNVATAKFCKYCGEQLAKQEEVKGETLYDLSIKRTKLNVSKYDLSKYAKEYDVIYY